MSAVAHLRRVLRQPRYTLYELLDIRPGHFDTDQARNEWRQLMWAVHPDRNKKDGALAAEVNAAYTVLSGRATRRLYDASLRTFYVECTTCAGRGELRRQRGFKENVVKVCDACMGQGWKGKPE